MSCWTAFSGITSFIKRSGLIPSYIANIDRMLQKMRRSEIYDG